MQQDAEVQYYVNRNCFTDIDVIRFGCKLYFALDGLIPCVSVDI
jgi:hypothetical protein